MDPQQAFCPNLDCPARGQAGRGTIRVHSRKERRYLCSVCGRTFAATRGTPLYRLHSPAGLVLVVLSLLSWGCPVQAIVHTFLLDERTVAAWLQRAGQHCQQVHQHLVQPGQVDLQHVQADELWVKLVGQRVWQAMAMAAPSRLWLGGLLSPQRDTALITALVQQVRACASSLAILVCVDGLASYVTAFQRVFREPVRTGRCGRPPLVVEPGLLIGQVVKRYAQRHVSSTSQRVVRGTAEAIRGRTGGDGDRERYPHGLHRAAERYLPQPPDAPGAPGARHRPHPPDAGSWDVAGWHVLQPVLDARLSPPGGSGRKRPHLVRAHSSHGSRADGPPLDPSRSPELSRATACLGRSQTAWPSAKAGSTANASRSLTPVQCGATRL